MSEKTKRTTKKMRTKRMYMPYEELSRTNQLTVMAAYTLSK